MSSRIALVTGGLGFIGSHTVDLLLDHGYEVRVIDNLVGGRRSNLEKHKNDPKLKIEIADIRTLKPGNKIFSEISHVFHFAGLGDIVPSIENPADYMSVNVQGTINILEAARSSPNFKKFVYAASSSCYGLAQTPTDETCPIKPLYPYALSKHMGEVACFHWHQVYNLPVNSIRIFNAYGTRSRTSGTYGAVFGVFLKQKLENKCFSVVGDGEQRRDFLYVTDVAKAFKLAAETEKYGQTWNLGAGHPQSINRLVELLEGEVEFLPKRPGEPDITFANIKKISNDLGFFPSVSFEQGVAKILENIEYWRQAPLWDKEKIHLATKSWFDKMS